MEEIALTMRYIARFVDSRFDNLDVYKKEIPNIEVYVDRNKNPIGAFIEALKMAGDDACIQMEDDCILTSNFDRKINEEVSKHPDSVIQFFSMRSKDLTIGSRWDSRYLMGQCTYYPKGKASQLVDYFKGSFWDENQHEIDGLDLLVSDFLKYNRERYWICIPNLVDHIVQKSIIDPRRSPKRVSKTFIK
jgi:hypothetical protein